MTNPADTATANTEADRDRRQRLWGARATLALFILALFIVQRRTDIAPAEEVAKIENYVDTYTVNVRSQQYGEDGRQTRMLESAQAAHYAVSDESVLQHPKIRSLSNTGKMWETRAVNGKVRPGGDVYDLWGTVFIEAVSGDSTARMDSLVFYSDRGQAETSDEVVIDTNIGQTIGVGMSANLHQEVLELHSEVRSVFDPVRR